MTYSYALSMAYNLRPAGRMLRELSRTQWLPNRDIQAIQLRKLRALLAHCYRTVPYYHKVMKEKGIRPEDVRSLNDLSRLVPVGKADIRKAPGSFRSRRLPRGVFEESTSGSTGEPFTFLRSKSTYEWELAGTLRAREWSGYRLGDRWADIRIQRRLLSLRERFAAARTDALLRRMRVDTYTLTGGVMMRGAERIASFEPFLVEAFPKILLEFGRFFEETKAEVPVVVSYGEGIAPFERGLVADRWGGEVYDDYGTTEAMAVSSECHVHHGLHIADDLYVVEFVKDGEPVSPGEHGRVLVTSLCNWVQPFIRYDVGDLSAPMDERCPCGRGLSLMSSVEGRDDDVIETEDGRLIWGEFTDWFVDVKVRQYQIEQLDRSRTVIRIVPDEGYTEEFGARIAGRARDLLGRGVEVRVRVVDAIRDYESGKRQVVKSNVGFPTVI